MTVEPGDRVLVPSGHHGIVKSVSAGGTVTLKSAVCGQRCFAVEETVVVQKAKESK